MDKQIITFQDIIKINEHDWDQAYEVLNYHLDKGNILKEIIHNADVIYHSTSGIQEHDLIHKSIISPMANPTEAVIRLRSKRINQKGDQAGN